MRSTLHKGRQVTMSASIAQPGASLSGLGVPASFTVGLGVLQPSGGTTILSGSDAIDTRSGDRSCAEAESFCSSTLSFSRADAEQERRSTIQLFASNQGELAAYSTSPNSQASQYRQGHLGAFHRPGRYHRSRSLSIKALILGIQGEWV